MALTRERVRLTRSARRTSTIVLYQDFRRRPHPDKCLDQEPSEVRIFPAVNRHRFGIRQRRDKRLVDFQKPISGLYKPRKTKEAANRLSQCAPQEGRVK